MRLALALLIASSVCGQALHPAGSRLSQRYLASWYVTVDSVAGNDGNSGKRGAPLATIAALPAVPAGRVIGLARGSSWREQLSIPADGIAVLAAGSGAKPLLDASDAIAAGAWSKTVGQTNVYEASLAFDWGGATHTLVWENGTLLTRAASLVACDAAAGSFYPSTEASSPITLYVHTSDSSDPGANGKLYEYSKRKGALIGGTLSYLTYRGIEGRRAANTDGAMTIGPHGRAYDCYAHDCVGHCFFLREWCYLKNVETFRGGLWSGSSLFVLNAGSTATGTSATLEDCYAHDDYATSQEQGIYVHTDAVHYFEKLTLIRFRASGMSTGISVNELYDLDVIDADIRNVDVAVACSYRDTLIDGGYLEGGRTAGAQRIVLMQRNNSSLTVQGGAQLESLNVTTTGVAAQNLTAPTVALADSSIHILAANWACISFGGSTNASLTASGMTYTGVNSAIVFKIDNAYAALSSDYNAVNPAGMHVVLPGHDYTWAQYKAATGQDAHSTP